MFRVKKGRMARAGGQYFREGVVLPDDLFGEGRDHEHRVAGWLRKGMIEEVDSVEPVVIEDEGDEDDKIAAAVAAGRASPDLRWTLNPADIKDVPLEQLNALVIERDPTVKPFSDAKEAIAFLSQDFDLMPQTGD